MRITVETPTGNHTFDGKNLEAKPAGQNLKIIDNGRTTATFKQWTNWRQEQDTK
ncbi:hypothetical protein ATK23_1449 [Glutamicibacter mysorens]|uniref:Uncharacterized protein n=1 Tax=Glutamicibacter mysorens TaxID=257984 RepID=A0ABX4MXZ5_9MICC|nr:hypothetical protein [Glutamicibacter mysorens]PJJ44221.1 hypothetical protein ATK23_1449 [Glutamicibacter mysorens]